MRNEVFSGAVKFSSKPGFQTNYAFVEIAGETREIYLVPEAHCRVKERPFGPPLIRSAPTSLRRLRRGQEVRVVGIVQLPSGMLKAVKWCLEADVETVEGTYVVYRVSQDTGSGSPGALMQVSQTAIVCFLGEAEQVADAWPELATRFGAGNLFVEQVAVGVIVGRSTHVDPNAIVQDVAARRAAKSTLVAEPALAEPATAEPATAEAATVEPATAEPAPAEPATAE